VRAELAERPAVQDAERHRFVDAIGEFFSRYGATATIGRVFALLLTSDAPLSLDDIAAWLGVSKSGASVATRDLERLALVRRQLTRGSRRVRYEACEDMSPSFEARFAQVRQLRDLLAQGEALVTSGQARKRLDAVLALHDFWLAESAGIMERWRNQ
jgi:DNA-binding transcriptional regulator GbsR (MarR family)